MALFSRIFQSRKSNRTSTTKWYNTEQRTKLTKPEFSGSQVRLVLYRDQDFKGRSLLFDSKAVHRADEEDAKGSKKKPCGGQRTSPEEKGLGGPPLPKYTYSRPGSDTKMLEEMSFGAVGMAFRGSTLKVHTIRTPPQLMFTKVFIPTLNRARDSCGVEGESLDCSLNYSSTELATPQKIAPNPSETNPSIAQSVPMDVPSPQTRYSDHEPEDSGFSTSAASSLSSLTASIPRSSSSSSLNSSSYNSMTRRWRRSQQTSLEHSLLKRQSDEGVYEQPLPSNKRPCKVGLAVVISLGEDDDDSARLFQNFFFSHITLIECHMDKLKLAVEPAMSNRKMFVHLMVEALENFRQLLVDLYMTPRLPEPIWLDMMCYTTHRVGLCERFLREFMGAVTKCDTKQTKFFLSTLITGVLTNHLAWVPTVTPAGTTPSPSYIEKHSAKWLDAVAKSHPYNPLWAQLGDLYGALGYPLRLTRTVVVGKKTDMVNRFLYILSYFIRCSEVLERAQQPYDFDDVDMEADTGDWPESSTDSVVTVPTSQPARTCSGKCNCGVQSPAASVSSDGSIGLPPAVCAQCQSNRMMPNNSFSSGSGVGVGSGPQLLAWPESTTNISSKVDNALPLLQTYVTPVKLKRGSMSGVAVDTMLSTEDCMFSAGNGRTPSEGMASPTCNRTASSVGPTLHGDSRLNTKSANISPQFPAVPPCISVVKQAVQPQRTSPTNPHSPQKESMHKRDSVEVEEINVNLKALVEGDALAVMCRMSPAFVSEEPNTVRVRHVGRQASDRSSTSPISRVHQGQEAFVGVKIENPRLEGTLNVDPSLLERTGWEDCIITTANCDIDNNVASDRNTDLEVPTGAKYEYSHDSGMYDTVVLPSDATCDTGIVPATPLPYPVRDSGLFLSDPEQPPRTPIANTFQELREEKMLKTEMFYHIPQSFEQQSNSMFDEYFTEDAETTGITEHVSGQAKLAADRFKRMASIEGSSSLFDEYFTSFESDGKCSADGEPCKSGGDTMASGTLCLGADDLCGHGNLAERRKAPHLDCLVMKPMKDEDAMPRPRQFSGQSSATLTPARTRSATPTDLSRCRHASSLSTTSSIEADFFTSLKEVDMPTCDHIEESVSQPTLFQRNFGRSLLAGASPHYLSDFVLHGTTSNTFQAALHNDLTMTVKNSVLDEQIVEAVCIVADIDNWTVKLQKCHYENTDRVRTEEVAASPLICNIIESVHNLWKLKMSPEFCLMHLEDRLQEIYFKSRTFAEFLRLHKRVDIKKLATMLKFDVNDIPLLTAVAGTHTPLNCMALL